MTIQHRNRHPKRRRPKFTYADLGALLKGIAAVLQALGYLIHGQ